MAAVSEFQARAWRRVVPVDAVLPPYPPVRDIAWSGTAGPGALFAGRLSPEKGAAEAIDIARAAAVPIDVYGDVYDAGYSREQIDPRRDWPGVTVHPGLSRAACRKHAESRLDLDVSLDAHERLYRRVAGG